MSEAIALNLLQLIALAVPPIAVLLQMLRRSENISWTLRKVSFGLAIASILSFIGAGITVLCYFLTRTIDPLLLSGLALTVFGLVPFAAFTGVLYREHKENVGP